MNLIVLYEDQSNVAAKLVNVVKMSFDAFEKIYLSEFGPCSLEFLPDIDNIPYAQMTRQLFFLSHRLKLPVRKYSPLFVL